MAKPIRNAERIVRWRQYKGLSRAQLADGIRKRGGRCSRTAVGYWETDDNGPTQENLELMCRVLGITLPDFYGRLPKLPSTAARKHRVTRKARASFSQGALNGALSSVG